MGFDAISVIKPFLGDGFRELAKRLEAAIFFRYGIPQWTEREHALHKKVDRLAAASEAVHVAGWTPEEVRNTLKISATPLDQDPLFSLYGGIPWEPWAPDLASERFLSELQILRKQI